MYRCHNRSIHIEPRWNSVRPFATLPILLVVRPSNTISLVEDEVSCVDQVGP